MQWLARSAPDLERFADVTREQVLAYVAFLETEIRPQTGKPLTTWTRRNYLAAVKLFFQQGAEWQWEDMPDHPLLFDSDQPKMPLNVPRYIPNDELVPLMEAIRKISCPYQRLSLCLYAGGSVPNHWSRHSRQAPDYHRASFSAYRRNPMS